MSNRAYGPEETKKLIKIITEGSSLLQEIDDLKESLKDTVKAVAEELDIKPSIINKVIKTVHKGNWADQNEDFQEVEAILDVTKKI